MKNPQTYKEWCDCLAIFEAGGRDEEVLRLMTGGRLTLQSGVIERISARVEATFSMRLKICGERFNRHLQNILLPEEISKALVEARRALRILQSLAQLEPLGEKLRDFLLGQLEQAAADWQRNLEDGARNIDRTGNILVTIRRSSLTNYKYQDSPAVTSARPSNPSQAFSGRRPPLVIDPK